MTKQQQEYIRKLESRAGKLTPQKVLDAAMPENSPLHEFFEWDDTVAAESYRMDQARELIRRVRIEITYEETTIRTVQYVHDRTLKSKESGYINVTKPKGSSARKVVTSEWEAVLALAIRARGITLAAVAEIPDGAAFAKKVEHVMSKLRGLLD